MGICFCFLFLFLFFCRGGGMIIILQEFASLKQISWIWERVVGIGVKTRRALPALRTHSLVFGNSQICLCFTIDYRLSPPPPISVYNVHLFVIALHKREGKDLFLCHINIFLFELQFMSCLLKQEYKDFMFQIQYRCIIDLHTY